MKLLIVLIVLFFSLSSLADEWGRDDLDAASLINAIEESIKIKKSDELVEINTALKRYGLTDSFYDFLKNRFELVELTNQLKVTGYYEPTLEASLTKNEKYRYPLYRYIPGIKNTRAEIDYGNALRGLEIAYVSDSLKLFFLHVQGSGILHFEDGSMKHALYAGNNGAEYFPIGKKLLSEGVIKEVSMQNIVEYLRQHPEREREVLSSNPRYIFFKLADEGPLGSLGGTLVPKRSVALDQNIYPADVLYLLESEEPQFDKQGKVVAYKKFSRFVLNHDSGAAITGQDRLDYFLGNAAELIAGHLNAHGRLIKVTK